MKNVKTYLLGESSTDVTSINYITISYCNQVNTSVWRFYGTFWSLVFNTKGEAKPEIEKSMKCSDSDVKCTQVTCMYSMFILLEMHYNSWFNSKGAISLEFLKKPVWRLSLEMHLQCAHFTCISLPNLNISWNLKVQVQIEMHERALPGMLFCSSDVYDSYFLSI